MHMPACTLTNFNTASSLGGSKASEETSGPMFNDDAPLTQFLEEKKDKSEKNEKKENKDKSEKKEKKEKKDKSEKKEKTDKSEKKEKKDKSLEMQQIGAEQVAEPTKRPYRRKAAVQQAGVSAEQVAKPTKQPRRCKDVAPEAVLVVEVEPALAEAAVVKPKPAGPAKTKQIVKFADIKSFTTLPNSIRRMGPADGTAVAADETAGGMLYIYIRYTYYMRVCIHISMHIYMYNAWWRGIMWHNAQGL